MAAVSVPGQTATYHLHNEASTITTGVKKLLTAGPDATAATAAVSLKSLAVGEYVIKEFETQTNDPNSTGVIPSGSTLSFTVWMRKTANVGTVFPRAKIRLNNSTGTLFCTATGSTALTTTVASQVFSCVTSANISMAASDRFYLWVGVNLTATSSTTFNGELDLEGTLNGNFDSRITLSLATGPPIITGLTPSMGAITTSVIIAGSNFRSALLSGSGVKFNGIATVPSVWTSTSITAPVPSGVPTGNVAATVTVGGQTSAAVNFTVTPAPSISSLAPSSGAIASSVTIAGTNFNTQGTGSGVKFNGTPATSITSWTTSSITAVVPAGATTGSVVVTAAGGVSSPAGPTFTVTSAPSITSLTPNTGAVGASVTIAGSNFNAQGAGSAVTFGGASATIAGWTSNSITAVVPSGAVSGNVVVTAAGGVASNGVNFTVIVAPTITSLTPSSGEPGASIAIAGNNFTGTTGTVTFNGLPASTPNWTNTSVTAVVPNGATNGNVVVSIGGLQSNGVAFTVLAPAISSVVPNTGAAGTVVTINGTNLGGSAGTVTFGGQSAAINTWTDGSIQAVVPATASTGNVVVSHGGLQTNGLPFTVSEQTFTGPVSYSYDELGRLVGAVANSGDAVKYCYDAVGNILSLTRYAAGQSAIFEFHPKSGPIGTSVSISGSNFSSNPAQDSVTFNGTTATIISATTTSLVVSVPPAATSGPLTISSPLGSTTTADSFTVTNSDGKPRIDSFAPQIALPGTAVTITGANFDTTPVNDRLIVNVTGGLNPTSATLASMFMSIPSATGSGRISLNTPSGSVTSSGDLFIPPSGYSVSAVGATGRVTPGAPATITLSAANQIGMLLFDGKKGQMVSAVASSSTFAGCSFYIYNPSNAYVLDSRSGVGPPVGSCATSGQFFDSQVLPATGTYTLLATPGSSTGHATLTTYLFDDVQGGLLTLGSPVTATTSVPGQNANFTFAGQPNQHVSMSISSSTFNNCYFTITNPDATILVNGFTAICDRSATFFDVPVLSQTGPYKLVIDPSGTDTGAVTFKLNDATDVIRTITSDGTPVTVATTIPGQKAKLTFSGSAGQVVSALLDNNTYNGVTMTLVAPDGSRVTGTSNTAGAQFIDASILPATGTYTLVLAPASGGTGQARIRLFNIASDFTALGTLGGPQIPITIGTPGQNAKITLTCTQGGRVAIAFSGAQFSGILSTGFSFKILQPDGTLFAGPFNGGPFSFPLSTASGFVEYNDVFTFPVSGTYTLIVDPDTDGTGSMTVTLDNATDLSLNINADGSANGVSTTNPGQNAHLDFSATIGQRISAVISNSTYSNQVAATLQQINSGGGVSNVRGAGGDGSNIFLEASAINQSGNYRLFLDPSGQDVGSATAALYTVNDVNTTVDTLNDPVTVTTTVPGQNANLTFSASAGQSLTLSVSGSTFVRNRCNVTLQNPGGFSMPGSGDCTGTGPWSTTQTAPQTGTYTIVVDPVQSSTGSLTVSMRVQ
jgi:YD repeat-containing protein